MLTHLFCCCWIFLKQASKSVSSIICGNNIKCRVCRLSAWRATARRNDCALSFDRNSCHDRFFPMHCIANSARAMIWTILLAIAIPEGCRVCLQCTNKRKHLVTRRACSRPREIVLSRSSSCSWTVRIAHRANIWHAGQNNPPTSRALLHNAQIRN